MDPFHFSQFSFPILSLVIHIYFNPVFLCVLTLGGLLKFILVPRLFQQMHEFKKKGDKKKEEEKEKEEVGEGRKGEKGKKKQFNGLLERILGQQNFLLCSICIPPVVFGHNCGGSLIVPLDAARIDMLCLCQKQLIG